MNKTSDLLTVTIADIIHEYWLRGHLLIAAIQYLLGGSLFYFKYLHAVYQKVNIKLLSL